MRRRFDVSGFTNHATREPDVTPMSRNEIVNWFQNILDFQPVLCSAWPPRWEIVLPRWFNVLRDRTDENFATLDYDTFISTQPVLCCAWPPRWEIVLPWWCNVIRDRTNENFKTMTSSVVFSPSSEESSLKKIPPGPHAINYDAHRGNPRWKIFLHGVC